jgi:hypothetical protein
MMDFIKPLLPGFLLGYKAGDRKTGLLNVLTITAYTEHNIKRLK